MHKLIEVEYRGCLRIEGISMNRGENLRFFDYDLDQSEEGVLRYAKRQAEQEEDIQLGS